METYTLRPDDIIGMEYPPRALIADVYKGQVVVLRINHPDETIADLRKHAAYMRLRRKTIDTRQHLR